MEETSEEDQDLDGKWCGTGYREVDTVELEETVRKYTRMEQFVFVFIVMGWSLLPNALRPFFKDLLCSPEFRYY